MAYHICYPLRADEKGYVYCKHCKKFLEKQFASKEGRGMDKNERN
jgi:hypothetical protein